MRQIYVSKIGNDSYEGSSDRPFATLERAFKELKSNGADELIIREGIYEVTEGLILEDMDNLRITAYNGEKVRLIGGRIIDKTKIEKVSDKNVKERLAPEAKDKIYQYDLKLCDIDLGENIWARYGEEMVIPSELFFDGNAGEIASYPKNDEWIPITEITNPGQSFIDGDGGRAGGTFVVEDDRVLRWSNADNLWIKGYVGRGYACEILPVSKIDIEKKTITLGENGYFGLNMNDKKRDFKVFNLLEEIEKPGEYFVDRNSGILYFYPPEDFCDDTEIIMSVLSVPILTLLNCKNITIDGIVFEMCRKHAIQIFSGENNSIVNCTVRNTGTIGISVGRKMGFDDVELVTSSRDFFEHKGLVNRYNLLAGEKHIIKDCHIYNCGSGGVYLGGGYRPTLKEGNNHITNCEIHSCYRWNRSHSPLIQICGVANKISHCKLHNNTSQAITLMGNEHLIEYNELYNLCSDIDDGGAFYMGRNPSEQGNVIRYNYFHHIKSRREYKIPIKDGFGVFSVYVDDGGSGVSIYGNVFYRGGNWAIANNGGSDIKVENNIFIESASCIWHTDNQVGRYSEENLPKPEPLPNGHSHLYYDKLLDTINIMKPPYSVRYPHLLNVFKEAGYPQRNSAVNNFAYRCLNFITTWHRQDQLIINPGYLAKDGESHEDVLKRCPVWYEQANNVMTSKADFLDFKGEWDFDIINSKIKEIISDFSSIPFDEIGLRK